MVKYLFSFLPLLALLSCTANTGNDSKEINTSKAEQTTMYSGNIGEFPITLMLSIQKNELIANYIYNKKGELISLNGYFKEGKLYLKGGKEYFEGSIDSNVITGIWSNHKTKIRFNLTKIDAPFISIFYKEFKNQNCKMAIENRKHLSDSSNYWDTLCTTIDVQLLKIKVSNKTIEDQINAFIEKEVCSFGSIFEENANYHSLKDVLNSVHKAMDGFGYEHSISCSFHERFKNILTFSISDFSYGFGAAHPNHFSVMYNIDLNTGKLIKLTNLFKNGTNKQLNKIAEHLFIKENGFEDWDFEKGKFELNSDFIIQKDGLLFTYDAYEIGPYAAGDPSVFIPYSKIKDLLQPNSILKEFKLK